MSDNDNRDQKNISVWIPKFEVSGFIKKALKQARYADSLLSDHYCDRNRLRPLVKLNLKEIYCIVEGNVPYFESILSESASSRDGVEGYVLSQSVILSLSSFASNVRAISQDLARDNIILEEQ